MSSSSMDLPAPPAIVNELQRMLADPPSIVSPTVTTATTTTTTTAAADGEKKNKRAAKKKKSAAAKAAGAADDGGKGEKKAAGGSDADDDEKKTPPRPEVLKTGFIKSQAIKDLGGYQFRRPVDTGRTRVNEKSKKEVRVVEKQNETYLIAKVAMACCNKWLGECAALAAPSRTITYQHANGVLTNHLQRYPQHAGAVTA